MKLTWIIKHGKSSSEYTAEAEDVDTLLMIMGRVESLRKKTAEHTFGCKCHIEPDSPWPRTSGGYQPEPSLNTLSSYPPGEE